MSKGPGPGGSAASSAPPAATAQVLQAQPEPAKLLCPWNFPGKNTGVGCHFLLQCMKVGESTLLSRSGGEKGLR